MEEIYHEILRGPLIKTLKMGEFYVNSIKEHNTKMPVSQYSLPPFCMSPQQNCSLLNTGLYCVWIPKKIKQYDLGSKWNT